MVFTSIHFLLFFALVLAIYWLLPRRAQNLWLLAGSCFFYGYWDWRFLFLLLLSTSVDYAAALAIEHLRKRGDDANSRRLLVLSVTIGIGLLLSFKWLGLFALALKNLDLGNHFGLTRAIVPIGISFYTFQSIGYVVDVYRREIPAIRSYLEFLLFISFFPQLVAGPIERAAGLIPQFRSARRLSVDGAFNALSLIVWGLYLKLVVADNMRPFVDRYWDHAVPSGFDQVWLHTYAGFFQMYGDFAGYSYMALGIAGLLGFELSLNFKFPLLSEGPREFWAHWHITLVNWFRDYFYAPLKRRLAERVAPGAAKLIAGFAAFVALALWHGFAWTYFLWGVVNAVSYALYRPIERRAPKSSFTRALRVFVWFHIVMSAAILFRTPDVKSAALQYTNMIRPYQGGAETLVWTLLLFAGPVLVLEAWHKYFGREEVFLVGRKWPLRLAFVTLAYLAVLIFGAREGLSFIYYQF